jgi:hypothetical protein
MTKTITNSRNSTLDSLLNTLRNFWVLLKPRNSRWREVRAEAIAEQRFCKKNRSWDREARRDWDIAHERVTFGDGMCTVETLVGDLIVSLEGNPFPGEQHTVLHVAVELFPDAKVMLDPKVFISGKKLWVRIFDEGRVDYRERIYFPVKIEGIDIAATEELLWKMVREDNTIVAADIPLVVNMEGNSKTYRTLKSKLQERKWVWSRRREGGKLVTIVTAPSRGDHPLQCEFQ